MYDDEGRRYYKSRHELKLSLPPDVHLKNKDEARCIRQLSAKTGLSEAELRRSKKYRQLIANARNKGNRPGPYRDRHKWRNCRWIMKRICEDLKLPREHPDVKDAFVNRYGIGGQEAYHWYCNESRRRKQSGKRQSTRNARRS